MTSAELASSLGLSPRYVYEWCCVQLTANHLLEYDTKMNKFSFHQSMLSFFPRKSCHFLLGRGYYGHDSQHLASIPPDQNSVFKPQVVPFGVTSHFGQMEFRNYIKIHERGYCSTLVDFGAWVERINIRKRTKIADIGSGHGVSTRVPEKLFSNPHILALTATRDPLKPQKRIYQTRYYQCHCPSLILTIGFKSKIRSIFVP